MPKKGKCYLCCKTDGVSQREFQKVKPNVLICQSCRQSVDPGDYSFKKEWKHGGNCVNEEGKFRDPTARKKCVLCRRALFFSLYTQQQSGLTRATADKWLGEKIGNKAKVAEFTRLLWTKVDSIKPQPQHAGIVWERTTADDPPITAGQQPQQQHAEITDWRLLPLGLSIRFPSLDKIELIMQRYVDQYVVTRSSEIHGAHHRRHNISSTVSGRQHCGQCLDSIASERRFLIARNDQLSRNAKLLLCDFMLLASLLCTGDIGQMFGEFNLKRMFIFFMQKAKSNSYERYCACGHLNMREHGEFSAENVVHSISNYLCTIRFTPPISTANGNYSSTQICSQGRVKCLHLLRDFIFRNYMNMHQSQGEQMERMCKTVGLKPYGNAVCICDYYTNNCTPAGAGHSFSHWLIINHLMDPTRIRRGAPVCPAGRLLSVADILEYIQTSEQFEEIFNPSDSDASLVYCRRANGPCTMYFGYPHGLIAGSSVFLCFDQRRYFRPIAVQASSWRVFKSHYIAAYSNGNMGTSIVMSLSSNAQQQCSSNSLMNNFITPHQQQQLLYTGYTRPRIPSIANIFRTADNNATTSSSHGGGGYLHPQPQATTSAFIFGHSSLLAQQDEEVVDESQPSTSADQQSWRH